MLAEVSRHELQKYEMIGRRAAMQKVFRDIEKAVGRRIDRSKIPVLPEPVAAPAYAHSGHAPPQRRFSPPRNAHGSSNTGSFNGGARSGNRRGR